MTTAEHIRWYAIKHYIAPARAAGREVVRIRLGDIRQKMGLTNPLQSVRSALGTKLFQDEAGVELLDPIGPRARCGYLLPFPHPPTLIEVRCRFRSKTYRRVAGPPTASPYSTIKYVIVLWGRGDFWGVLEPIRCDRP